MTYFYLFCLLMILFFLTRNVVALGEYRRLSKEAVFVFEDQRRKFRVSRVIFGVLLGLSVVLLIVTLALWGFRDPNAILAELVLMAGCVLFAFLPYTNGRFVITKDGIYVYNAVRFIPWKEMISVSPVGRKKDSYLFLNTSREESEKLRRTTFPLMITPADKTETVLNMIRDLIALETKKQRLERLKNGV